MSENYYDVIVVGAGPSGIPAAVAAARNGARVLLLEEDSMPGGAPIDMFVAMTCGDPRGGIYSEMLNYMNERHTLDKAPIMPFDNGMDGCNHWWMPYAYIDAAMHLINSEKNITLMTGACVCGIISETDVNNTIIKGVEVRKGQGSEPYYAKVTIDASGTGILGELAGCDVRYGGDARSDFDEPYAPDERDKKIMPCTLMYITQRLSGTSMPRKEEFSKLAHRSGFVEDKLHMWSSALYDEAVHRNVGIYLHWGATVDCADTRDAMALGKAQMDAIAMIKENAELWYEYGFTVQVAPKIGVRECRRVMGEKVLTIFDMLHGTKAQDTIAVSNYGVDLWGSAKLKEADVNRQTKPYGIPYGALLPKNTKGLLMAGKSISGSRFACSSYRVQPIVAAIGEAAGTAAAMSIANNTTLRDVNIASLQSKLMASTSLSKTWFE